MRAAILASLIAAAGLAGCATPTPAPRPVAAGMAWSLNAVEGEGLKLAYGKPDSDDVLVMLSCEPGQGHVRVSALASHASHAIALASGGLSRTYPAEAGPSGVDGGFLVEGAAAPDDPVLARFARTGELTLGVDGRRTALPTDASGEAAKFMKTCRFG